MISHELHLNYELATGWLKPYVNGLQNGKVIASKCKSCGRKSFPPQQICGCGDSNCTWETLEGGADIIHNTEGTDGQFALVQFDGCDTATVVRLDGLSHLALRGQISRSTSQLPQIVLGPLSSKTPK